MKALKAGIAAALMTAAFVLSPIGHQAHAALAFDASYAATKPAAIGADGAHHRFYAGQEDGDFIVYSTQTSAETARLKLGCCISSMVVDPGNDRVIVAGNGLFVIDAAQATVVATIGLNGDALGSVALDTPALHAYVVLPARGQVAVVDLTTMQVTNRFQVTTGLLGQIGWYNGGRLFVTERDAGVVHALDARTGAEAGPINAYLPISLAIDTANGVVYAGSQGGTIDMIDAVTFNHFRSLASGTVPVSLALGNARVWVADSSASHLRLLRSSDGAILDRYPLAGPQGSVVFDAASSEGYVSVSATSQVLALHETPGVVKIETPFPNAFLGANSSFVTGSAPPGATVTVFENGVAVGSAVADDSSRWSAPVSLPEGTHTVVAAAPEESTTAPRTFQVDLTPPTPALIYRTPANASGWNNTTVFLRWSCTDAYSGPVQSEIDTILDLDGKDLHAGVTCADKAGNTATLDVGGFNVDRTYPRFFVNHSPFANSAGWNRVSSVNVTLRCADAFSGMAGDYQPVSATITGETSGTPLSIVCRTFAGNVRTYEHMVRIDTTKPQASVDDSGVAVQPLPIVQDVAPITGTVRDDLSKPKDVHVMLKDSSGTSVVLPASCSARCGESTMQWSLSPVGVAPGLYTVRAQSTDFAGNLSDWSAPRTILILVSP